MSDIQRLTMMIGRVPDLPDDSHLFPTNLAQPPTTSGFLVEHYPREGGGHEVRNGGLHRRRL